MKKTNIYRTALWLFWCHRAGHFLAQLARGALVRCIGLRDNGRGIARKKKSVKTRPTMKDGGGRCSPARDDQTPYRSCVATRPPVSSRCPSDIVVQQSWDFL